MLHAVRLAWIRERCGLIGLYAFSLFAWLSHGRALLGLALVVLACVADPRFWAMARRSALVWVAGLTAVYILIRTVVAATISPDLTQVHWLAGEHLLLLCAFVFVGWCMGGSEQRILVTLMLAMAGFTIGRIEHFDLAFDMPWFWQRPQFGFPTAVAFGNYAAVVALGLVVMAPRLWRSIQGRTWKWIAMSVLVLAVLALMQGVVLSQARATWFGLVILLPLTLMLYRHKLMSMSWAKIAVFSLTLALAGLAFIYFNYETISKRIASGSETYMQLLSANVGNVDSRDSIGVLIHMHLLGLKHWKSNPLLGHGPGSTRLLLETHIDELGGRFNDLHNTYIEFFVQIGLVGAGLLFICIWFAFVAGWQAYQEQSIHFDVFTFLTIALALHLLANFTSSRMLSKDGAFFWLLFGGALITTALTKGRIPHHLSLIR